MVSPASEITGQYEGNRLSLLVQQDSGPSEKGNTNDNEEHHSNYRLRILHLVQGRPSAIPHFDGVVEEAGWIDGTTIRECYAVPNNPRDT